MGSYELILYKIVLVALGAISIITFIVHLNMVSKYDDAQDKIKQLEIKNEVLQEDNSSLTDQVCNLNKALEGME